MQSVPYPTAHPAPAPGVVPLVVFSLGQLPTSYLAKKKKKSKRITISCCISYRYYQHAGAPCAISARDATNKSA
jgi:hypothetical protein